MPIVGCIKNKMYFWNYRYGTRQEVRIKNTNVWITKRCFQVLGVLGLSHAAPQKDFRASVGPGFNGDPGSAKIIAEQRFLVDNGNRFGHAAHQVRNHFYGVLVTLKNPTAYMNWVQFIKQVFDFCRKTEPWPWRRLQERTAGPVPSATSATTARSTPLNGRSVWFYLCLGLFGSVRTWRSLLKKWPPLITQSFKKIDKKGQST